jgi:hypothetical protein
MKHGVRPLFAAAIFAFAVAASSAEIDVMTQNQYLGADLTPIIAAGSAQPFDPVAFNAAVVTALSKVAANLPQQRFAALAGLITKRGPHLVGLQEVFRYDCQGPGCADPAIAGAFNDHLQGTLDSLGGAYVVKATVKNLDLTLPVVTSTGQALVTVIDRDVILARSDIASAVAPVPFNAICTYPSMDGCNYDVVGEVSLGGATVRIERGFVGVDASVDDEIYRFVNTHLEVREPAAGNPYSRIVQAAQAYQLLLTVQGTTPTDRKLLVVGDINSDPRDEILSVPPPLQPLLGTDEIVPPYLQFSNAQFTDTWTLRPGANTGNGAPLAGFSCCQDEDLGNHQSVHYERIDIIFSQTLPRRVQSARLLGESIADKTWPKGLGLWPSDHSSVAARLHY